MIEETTEGALLASAPRLQTYTGRIVNPLDLKTEDIDIRDIAHALACINRFNGHARQPISVAQHSVFVSELCPSARLQALLHDASEAYLGDVTRWLKKTPEFAAYRLAEQRAQEVIYARFGCPTVEHPEIDVADRLMVRVEATRSYLQWESGDGAYQRANDVELNFFQAWEPWAWSLAEHRFLDVFDACT